MKYQNATCQQLWAERAAKAPPTPQQQKVIQFLRSDPQMRAVYQQGGSSCCEQDV